MKRTVILAIAICLFPLRANALFWEGFDWTISWAPTASAQIITVSANDLVVSAQQVPGTLSQFWALMGPPDVADFDITVSISKQKGNLARERSIMWGVPPGRSILGGEASFFHFSIANAAFCLHKRINGKLTILVNWTNSSALRPHLGDWNTMRVKRTGDDQVFWINGIEVLRYSDATLRTGQLGFYTEDTLASLVRFRSFAVTYSVLAGARNWTLYE